MVEACSLLVIVLCSAGGDAVDRVVETIGRLDVMCERFRVAGFNTRRRGGPSVFNTELHAECERLLNLSGCGFGLLVVDSHVEGVLLGLCGRDALPVAQSMWGSLDQNASEFIMETCIS